MKIFIGTDHAGYGLKEKLLVSLKAQGHEVVDKGAFSYNEEDDYPDFVVPVAREVSKDSESRGIVIGATGQAEAVAANKFPNVRAMVYYGKPQAVVDDQADVIVRSRQHNNSNVLSLGARYLTEDDMMESVNKWLDTKFSGEEKYERRLSKVEKIKINE